MSARRWNPFEDLYDVQRDISRFFRRAFGVGSETLDSFTETGRAWMPAIDMYADDGKLVIKAELPGVTSGDIDVHLSDNTLTISGQRKSEKEVEQKNYYRMESSYGKFKRSISVPEGVKPEDIKASYDKGVLTIEVPGGAKKAEKKPIHIEVK